jgi:uncharacterized damage-inducible protein DinB
MTKNEIHKLFEYDRWATAQQLEAASRLGPEAYHRDFGDSFGGVHGTLVHIYGAQKIWLERWNGGTPAGLSTAKEIPTLSMLTERWAGLRDELNAFIQSLTDAKLVEPLAYKDLKGNPFVQPLVGQMQHLINHGTYHRGQVTTLLRLAGGTPVSTDLIRYLREI